MHCRLIEHAYLYEDSYHILVGIVNSYTMSVSTAGSYNMPACIVNGAKFGMHYELIEHLVYTIEYSICFDMFDMCVCFVVSYNMSHTICVHLS